MSMRDASGNPLTEYTGSYYFFPLALLSHLSIFCLDMVVENDGDQDVTTTMSLLEGFLLLVHERFPHIKKVVLLSDNGTSYLICQYLVLILLCVRLALCIDGHALAHGSFQLADADQERRFSRD